LVKLSFGLPRQFSGGLGHVFGVFFAGLHLLFIYSFEGVPVFEEPFAFKMNTITLSIGFVVLEGALVDFAIGEYPFSSHDIGLLPLSLEAHSGLAIDIGAFAVLLAVFEPARKYILVQVGEDAFAVSPAVFKVAYLKRTLPKYSPFLL
jgi:hypothetical protein